MKRYQLVRRGLISGIDTANDVGSCDRTGSIRQLLVAKSLDEVIEVRGSVYGEASEENCSCMVEQRLEERFLGFDGIDEKGKRWRGNIWREDGREREGIVVLLLCDLGFFEDA